MVVVGSIIVSAGTFFALELASKAISSAVGIAQRDISEKIGNAVSRGNLPPNHTVERAVLRSSILATQVCLLKLSKHEADALPENIGKLAQEWKNSKFGWGAPVAGADKWLSAHAAALRHNARSEKRRQDAIRELLRHATKGVMPSSEVAIAKIAGLECEKSDLDAVLSLRDGIIAETIRIGKWADQKSAYAQLTAACVEDDFWGYAFAQFYAEELKTDEAFRSIIATWQLAALGKLVSVKNIEVINQLSSGFEKIAAQIEKLENSAPRGMDLWATKTMFMTPNSRRRNSDAQDKLHFSMEYDEFIGRGKEIKIIEEKMFTGNHLTSDKFRWMAICGEGGTGKSRLCLELMDRALQHGFVNSGFIDSKFIAQPDFIASAATQLRQNTLLIVDYSTGSQSHIPTFLADWVRYAASFEDAVTVRLLLVLRNARDPLFEKLERLPALRHGPEIERAEQRPSDGQRLTLSKLSGTDTRLLMENRIASVAAELDQDPKQADGDELTRRLSLFDPFRRPLFALVVADAFQRGILDDVESDKSREEARFDLIERYLKRQRKEYWKQRLDAIENGVAESKLEPHENALRLATAVMGISLDDYKSIKNSLDSDIQPLLPAVQRLAGVGDLHAAVVRSMNGTDMFQDDEKGFIRQMEPDMIGECFVLRGPEYAEEKNCCLTPKEIIAHAYAHDPEKTLEFLRLATQDYPHFMAENNFLLPDLTPTLKGEAET